MPTEMRIIASVMPMPVARFLGHARMRGRGGMRDQRLGAAQAHRELHDLQRIQHAERLGFAAADRERKRGAGAQTLPLRTPPRADRRSSDARDN